MKTGYSCEGMNCVELAGADELLSVLEQLKAAAERSEMERELEAKSAS